MNNARKSWNRIWKQLCPVRSRTTSVGNPAAKNQRKELCLKIMQIALQERDSINEVITIFVHKFISMRQAMNIPDVKAAVDKKNGQARKIASMANDQKGRASKKVIKEAQK